MTARPRSSGDTLVAGREGELVRQILDYLRLRGIPATRNQAGHVRVGRHWVNLGVTGWPDVIACWRGRLLGIEAKRPGEGLRATQAKAHGELRQAGALILVIHDLDELGAGLGKGAAGRDSSIGRAAVS